MASIPTDFVIDPLSPPSGMLQFVDQNGRLTSEGVAALREYRDFISGVGRVIPCDAANQNNIVLTPTETAPVISAYKTFDIYVFKAAATANGAITINVQPRGPSAQPLGAKNAYKASGATSAGSGDTVLDSVYMAIFADHLNSNAGGFVLK
jgi:hypothetical protein